MRVLIVDDEPLARERLRGQLNDLEKVSFIAEAANGFDALQAVVGESIDVILLDIRMPGMDGLEVAAHLAKLANPPALIFTTAYEQHALAAFEANAIDYLLKPIRDERLSQALVKASVLTEAQVVGMEELSGATARAHISGTVKGNLQLVAVNEVYYFQATQGYVEVVSASGSMLIEDSLRNLEEEFGEKFLRVHRNSLVNPNFVSGIKRTDIGNFVVTLRESNETLPISRRLLNEVKTRLR